MAKIPFNIRRLSFMAWLFAAFFCSLFQGSKARAANPDQAVAYLSSNTDRAVGLTALSPTEREQFNAVRKQCVVLADALLRASGYSGEVLAAWSAGNVVPERPMPFIVQVEGVEDALPALGSEASPRYEVVQAASGSLRLELKEETWTGPPIEADLQRSIDRRAGLIAHPIEVQEAAAAAGVPIKTEASTVKQLGPVAEMLEGLMYLAIQAPPGSWGQAGAATSFTGVGWSSSVAHLPENSWPGMETYRQDAGDKHRLLAVIPSGASSFVVMGEVTAPATPANDGGVFRRVTTTTLAKAESAVGPLETWVVCPWTDMIQVFD